MGPGFFVVPSGGRPRGLSDERWLSGAHQADPGRVPRARSVGRLELLARRPSLRRRQAAMLSPQSLHLRRGWLGQWRTSDWSPPGGGLPQRGGDPTVLGGSPTRTDVGSAMVNARLRSGARFSNFQARAVSLCQRVACMPVSSPVGGTKCSRCKSLSARPSSPSPISLRPAEQHFKRC